MKILNLLTMRVVQLCLLVLFLIQPIGLHAGSASFVQFSENTTNQTVSGWSEKIRTMKELLKPLVIFYRA